jgi:hypothetical protein
MEIAMPGESYARLWQDPLGLTADTKPTAGTELLLAGLEAAAKGKWRAYNQHYGHDPDKLRVLLLPVLLSGKGNPEDVETRLRMRYAVISALGRAQYIPSVPDRIMFANVDSDNPEVPFEEFDVRLLVTDNVEMAQNENNWVYDGGKDSPKGIPPREFERRLVIPQPYDRVVVVWLNQESAILREHSQKGGSASKNLSATLAHLVSNLVGSTAYHIEKGETKYYVDLPFSLGSGSKCTTADIDLKVVGPYDTDNLVALLDGEPSTPDASGPHPLSFKLLSSRATAADGVLQISLTRDPTFENYPLKQMPDAPGATVERTIGTDDSLVRSMLGELRNRGVEIGPEKHLVLIGEWDTLYSRGLGRSFASALNQNLPSEGNRRLMWASNPFALGSESSESSFLHEYSYLRGLDGRSTDASARKSTSKDSPDGSASSPGSAPAKDPDGAEGERQNDYLRRLEAQVKELEFRLANPRREQTDVTDRYPGPKATIGAIGVIGTDVYDKLMVLRALRRNFPGVIFFTTDMDATLMDTTESDWTRNLLVVSPFGLAAAESLQGRIPPFRDSYQTALFLTVLKAVGVERVGSHKFVLGPYWIKPRLFELGRSGYVDLSEREKPLLDLPNSPTPLHPASESRVYIHIRALTALALAIVVLAGFAFHIWSETPLSGWQWIQIFFGTSWALTLGGVIAFHVRYGAGWGSWIVSVLLMMVLFCKVSDAIFDHVERRWSIGNIVSVSVYVVTVVTAFCLLYVGIRGVSAARNEEPFSWFNGVSVWPTEILRVAVIFVATMGVVTSQAALRRMKRKVADKFGLFIPPLAEKALSFTQTLRLSVLFCSDPRAENNSSRRERYWWGCYYRITTPKARLWRIAAGMILSSLIFVCLYNLTGSPAELARGSLSRAIDSGAWYAALIAYIYLLFHVFDATVIAGIFITKLDLYLGSDSDFRDVDAMHIVNDISNVIAGIIYWPFSALFILIVSRNRLFSNWDWPVLLILVFFTGLVLIAAAALFLQQRVRRAKEVALDFLDGKIIQRLDFPSTDPAKRSVESLREERNQIMAFNGVAFQPWYQNPIFQAILIPLGGIGSLQLIERFATKLF